MPCTSSPISSCRTWLNWPSGLCCLQAVVGMGELFQIVPLAHAAVTSLGAWPCFWLLTANSLLGMLLNYSLFLCTVHNSALTTTIVGVLKVCNRGPGAVDVSR